MKRVSRHILAMAACVAILAAIHQLSAKGSSSTVSAIADFRDATATSTSPSDKIRSDGGGLYQNGIDCVISEVFTGPPNPVGEYFLRTVTPSCSTTTPRAVVLDFSTPVPGSGPSSCSVTDPNFPSLTLNACGANAIADTRLFAGTMFTVNALTNGTSVSLRFSLKPNFQGTGFELDFEQPVAVTGTSGLRTATAGPAAVAELYEFVSVHGKVSKVSVGRYYMPFQATVGE